jgi:hypothetical protein
MVAVVLHHKRIDPRMGPTIKWTRDGTGQMGWVVNVDMVHMDCVNKNYSNPRKRGESWSSLRGSTLTGYLSVISPWPFQPYPLPAVRRQCSFRPLIKGMEKTIEKQIFKLIQHKLSQFGLTKEEIEARLHQLDDEQIHQIASQIHGLEPGGNGAEVFLIILVLAIAAFVVLELTGVIDVFK